MKRWILIFSLLPGMASATYPLQLFEKFPPIYVPSAEGETESLRLQIFVKWASRPKEGDKDFQKKLEEWHNDLVGLANLHYSLQGIKAKETPLENKLSSIIIDPEKTLAPLNQLALEVHNKLDKLDLVYCPKTFMHRSALYDEPTNRIYISYDTDYDNESLHVQILRAILAKGRRESMDSVFNLKMEATDSSHQWKSGASGALINLEDVATTALRMQLTSEAILRSLIAVDMDKGAPKTLGAALKRLEQQNITLSRLLLDAFDKLEKASAADDFTFELKTAEKPKREYLEVTHFNGKTKVTLLLLSKDALVEFKAKDRKSQASLQKRARAQIGRLLVVLKEVSLNQLEFTVQLNAAAKKVGNKQDAIAELFKMADAAKTLQKVVLSIIETL